MENPIKMDDLGVPLFSETSIFFLQYVFDLKGLHVSVFTLHSISIDDPTKNDACEKMIHIM